MNTGRAIAIFENIDEAAESIEEKGLAIRKVLDMETHNSVSKQSILKVANWLWNQLYEMDREGKHED